jgi:hypothetical protein
LWQPRWQQQADDPNVVPTPYHMLGGWALKLPCARALGRPIGMEIDHGDGRSLWMFERCGSDEEPTVNKFVKN